VPSEVPSSIKRSPVSSHFTGFVIRLLESFPRQSWLTCSLVLFPVGVASSVLVKKSGVDLEKCQVSAKIHKRARDSRSASVRACGPVFNA
jgi:hypothetical protein